jgi:eukaryotic-like serine/threonine-protein kinase
VPDIIGLPYTRARLQLERLGLRVARSDGGHSTAPAGSVVASSPPPGSRLARGSTVTLTVSSGPAPAPKPHGKGHGHHEKHGKDD